MKRLLSVFLALIFAVSVFANPFSNAVHAVKLEGNEILAMNIAEEGIVLLKNDNSCLPFTSNMRIGLYGSGQSDGYVVGGGGSGWVNTDTIVTPLLGLQLNVFGGRISDVTTMTSTSQAGFDRVVYFLTRPSTEGDDRKAVEGDYYLSTAEKDDISALVRAYPGKVTVVLNVAGIVDTTWLLNSGVSSILLLWLAGASGGAALANVLTGKVSPSGKLVDTWAKDYNDYLSSANFASVSNVYYYEDIFVGYRQFETFDPQYQKVNFEFGFGLSYTDFQITTNSVAVSDGNVNINVTVKNVGSTYSGKEVVQAYYSAPDAVFGNPAKELGAFAKTKLLAPGESETLNLSFPVNDMASYDDTGKIKKSAWILEKGQYKFYVGNSIKNAAHKGVAGTYTNNENVIVEECSEFGTIIDKRLLSNGTYEEFVSQNVIESNKTHTVSPYGFTDIPAVEFYDLYDKGVVAGHYHGTTYHSSLTEMYHPGAYVTYMLDVEKAGEYNLALSLCDWGTKENCCAVYVNGVNQNVTYNVNNGVFSPSILTAPQKINLPKGKVELKLVGNELSNVSHLYISNSSISPSGNTIIEAESARDVSSPLCTDDVFQLVSGKTATYNVYAEEAGTYYLSLNYSNVGNALDNALNLNVNGAACGSFGLSKTGFDPSFACASENISFEESECIAVTLNAGNNTVKLTANADLSAYVDYIVFSKNKNTIKYKDNTGSFLAPKLDGAFMGRTIYFDELYNSLNDADGTNDLLDEFISQLSIKDMANMASLYTKLDTAGTETGGFGVVDASEQYFSGKYGLFSMTTADGPAGVRSNVNEYFTYMPCVSLLASTWNVDLAYKFGEAIGKEAAIAGVKVWLAPGANIHRNPLCGRNFEYISEDPFVTGTIASQIINGCQSQGVGCSLKHFAANNKEHNRHCSNTIVSERALREIYLKGFEIAIKASNPVTVMTSYNLINGVPTECDAKLLREIAREEWGYEGVFISDWDNNTSHPVSIVGGNNVISQNPNPDEVVRAYISGYLTRETLEENTRYILLGMERVYKESSKPLLQGHEPIDLGPNFYAEIKQTYTGRFVVEEDTNVCARDHSQAWHFVRRANGAYSIVSTGTGRCLDVVYGIYEDGTNIQTYDNNASGAQKFYIYYIEGNYYFRTAFSDRLIDVDAATNNVQLWGNDTGIGLDEKALTARSFSIIKKSPDFINEDLNLGTSFDCYIKNSATGLMLTAEGDNAIFRSETKADNQKWIVTRSVNGGYTIKSVANGKVLDVAAAGTDHGTDINLWDTNGTNAQRFYFIDAGNSKVYIKPSYTDLYMDMDASNLEIHACMYGNEDVHKTAQHFELVIESRREDLILKSDSALEEKDGYLLKVKEKTSVSEVLSNFENTNVSVFNSEGEVLQSSDFCGTGCKVVLHENGIAIDSLEVIVLGDVDGNGNIDSTDYLRIKSVFLDLYTLEGSAYKAADVDGSQKIDATDYLKIKSHFLKVVNLYE